MCKESDVFLMFLFVVNTLGRDQSSDVHSPESAPNKVAVHAAGVCPSVNDIVGAGLGRSLRAVPRSAQSTF